MNPLFKAFSILAVVAEQDKGATVLLLCVSVKLGQRMYRESKFQLRILITNQSLDPYSFLL